MFDMYTNVKIIFFYIYFIFVVLLYWKAYIVHFHLSYIHIAVLFFWLTVLYEESKVSSLCNWTC